MRQVTWYHQRRCDAVRGTSVESPWGHTNRKSWKFRVIIYASFPQLSLLYLYLNLYLQSHNWVTNAKMASTPNRNAKWHRHNGRFQIGPLICNLISNYNERGHLTMVQDQSGRRSRIGIWQCICNARVGSKPVKYCWSGVWTSIWHRRMIPRILMVMRVGLSVHRVTAARQYSGWLITSAHGFQPRPRQAHWVVCLS